MTAPRPLPALGLLAALATLLFSGCGTPYGESSLPVRAPITYAIVLYLPEGESLDDNARLNALSLARDTLLASGIITPQDQMIDDVERAQQLYRARVENGVLTEIAGVPSVSNATTVVLSRPRYSSGGRVFWDTTYPYGYPGSFDSIHSGFPLPSPGWGYPAYGRGYDRYDRRDWRDRRDRDQRDRDHRDRGDRHDGNRGDRDRGDRDRDRGDRDHDRDRGPRPPRGDHNDGNGNNRLPPRDHRPPSSNPGGSFTPPPRPQPAPPPPRTSPAPSLPPPSVDRDNSSSTNTDRGTPDRGRYRRDKNN